MTNFSFVPDIIFRVDAGSKVGLGHYFRSINLANLLNYKFHMEVLFCHNPDIFWKNNKEIPSKEINVVNEEKSLKILINKYKPKLFYVDSMVNYSTCFAEFLSQNGIKLIQYQNLTNFRIYSDIFILPSIYHDKYFFNSFLRKTKIYKGLDYFIPNKEVFCVKRNNKSSIKEIRNIAVTAGGSDPLNILIRFYDIIASSNLNFNEVRFVLFYGISYCFKDKIPISFRRNIAFEKFSINKILKYDCVFSVFGVSAYEFMYLKIPVIGLSYNDQNEKALKLTSKETQAILDGGRIENLNDEKVMQYIQILNQEKTRNKLIKNSSKVLNGKGVHKVANIINKLINE